MKPIALNIISNDDQRAKMLLQALNNAEMSINIGFFCSAENDDFIKTTHEELDLLSDAMIIYRGEMVTADVSRYDPLSWRIDNDLLSDCRHYLFYFDLCVDFIDYDGRQISSPDRRELLYRTINAVEYLLDRYPGALFFLDSPHSTFDIILALAAEKRGRSVICLRETHLIPNHYFIQPSIGNPRPMQLEKKKIRNRQALSKVLIDYRKLQSSHSSGSKIQTPTNTEFRDHRLAVKGLSLGWRFVYNTDLTRRLFEGCWRLLYINYMIARYALRSILKNVGFNQILPDKMAKKSIQLGLLGTFTEIDKARIDAKCYSKRRQFRDFYERISVGTNQLPEVFVYFPLHYQPEATTTPYGGVFTDQLNLVRLLASQLPEGKSLVVKEHPDTFNINLRSWSRGTHSRSAYFYETLSKLPNVVVSNLDVPGDYLLERAVGVVTLTGQSAIQAAEKGVSAFAMGDAWYSFHEGVSFGKTKVELYQWLESLNEKKERDAYQKSTIFFQELARNSLLLASTEANDVREFYETVSDNLLSYLSSQRGD